MKYISFLIIGLSLLADFKISSANDVTASPANIPVNKPDDTLKFMSSPELYNLITIWVREYTRVNPGVNIRITNGAEDPSVTNNSLCFSSNEVSNVAGNVANNVANWKMVIGHDVIVPVINSKNPMLDTIYKHGISPKGFTQLFGDPEKLNWANIIKGGQNRPVHVYIIENEFIKTGIANFTKTDRSSISGISIPTSVEFAQALQKDLFSIGFCKLTDICKPNSNELSEDIKFLPIDKNDNGRIDNFENIYVNPSAFLRGVWIGKYPKTLCGSIYAIAPVKPTDNNTVAFLTWAMSDGGKFLTTNGYNNLAGIEIESNLSALLNNDLTAGQSDESRGSILWIMVLSGLVITLLILAGVAYNFRSSKSTVNTGSINIISSLNENLIAAPKGLYFDKSHTWAFMEKDGIVKVGIDDFIQHITGTITRIKMKESGEMVRKGEKILTIIRDGKQLNINAPVSGIIKEKNLALIADPSIINSSPYSDGWVYMIQPKNWLRETQFLLMSEKYKEWLRHEFSRLKDFISASVNSNSSVYEHVILQDGGQLTDNVLADLGPEVWEDFQIKFIDKSI